MKANEEPCKFVATDGRPCELEAWHNAPRARKGYYVTRGDIGDAHLLLGKEDCKWGNKI